ncbi:MAG TPA: trehalose-phosphatase [Streptosporangiaceae bacterium]|nr:trehalose-phosphatase [Streptosporangiaceae bacterium]
MAADSLPGYDQATQAGQAGLRALLAEPGSALIALDFDGTLAPIVEDPAQARPLPESMTALRALAASIGTLAVITGRLASRAVEYGALDQIPGIIVLGQYGRQRWEAGQLTGPPPPPGLADARAELPKLLSGVNAPQGTQIEDKGDALAVHTRRTDDPAGTLDRLADPLRRLAARTGLRAEPGRMVIELRPDGTDKGQALENLTAERMRSAIMFCGDDLGDRPAFEAVRRLRAAGQPGIAVCSKSAEVPGLAGEADLVVDGPAGVAGLLSGLAAEVGGQT